nr:MAG TPA: Protein of unknown function (DUF669) [Caudoviricetes sp.]
MTEYNNNFEQEIGWDDVIQQDQEFVLLPEGLYEFTVTGFERARHIQKEGGKIPSCNKTIVSVEVVAPQGEVTMKHNLFLHKSKEGLLSAFFGAIGLKKKGKPFKMEWNTITGARGVCKVGIRTYNGNQYNEVKAMLYPEDVNPSQVLNRSQQPAQQFQQTQQVQQQYQQQATQQPQQSWGAFN